MVSPSEKKNFLNAAEVCDNQTVEDMIKDMTDDILQMAYSRTWNNVRIMESDGFDSDYRSTLEIIKDEMTSRGMSPKSSKPKKASR
jgi:hypothetical protein